MVFTSYFLEYKLWRMNFTGYHITNILLHGLSCLLLWRLLEKLGLKAAWLCAMILALHPVMVESMAWITERKNVLSLVFYLGIVLLLGMLITTTKRIGRGPLATILILVCSIVSMLKTKRLKRVRHFHHESKRCKSL